LIIYIIALISLLLNFQWLVLEVQEVVGVDPPLPPPRIFAKVVARYAPLSLPAVLHNLPENYMKILPKFMGEGI
jgi:hypothetical protein